MFKKVKKLQFRDKVGRHVSSFNFNLNIIFSYSETFKKIQLQMNGEKILAEVEMVCTNTWNESLLHGTSKNYVLFSYNNHGVRSIGMYCCDLVEWHECDFDTYKQLCQYILRSIELEI